MTVLALGALVTVRAHVNGKPAPVRARIAWGPNRQGLYRVEFLEESDNFLEGDAAPYYRREIEPT